MGDGERREFPWRVARWREVMAVDGSIQRESNARMVEFDDGSRFLYIGKDTVYEVRLRPVKRAGSDAFSLTGSSLTHFANLDERMEFRLVKEPKHLQRAEAELPRGRKVKMAGGISVKQELAEMVEEDKRLSRQRSQRKLRDKQYRQTSSAKNDLNKDFLEEGTGYAQKDRYEDDYEVEERPKRGRTGAVDEEGIMRAKSGVHTKRSKEEQQLADGLELYDDSFIDDEDEDDGTGRGMVVASDSE